MNLNTDNRLMNTNEENEDVKNDVEILNLDISTMLAYISELSNGGYNWIFKEKILTKQAENERKNPVKIILDKIFEGLVTSNTILLKIYVA